LDYRLCLHLAIFFPFCSAQKEKRFGTVDAVRKRGEEVKHWKRRMDFCRNLRQERKFHIRKKQVES
jgi:hypothetical protein